MKTTRRARREPAGRTEGTRARERKVSGTGGRTPAAARRHAPREFGGITGTRDVGGAVPRGAGRAAKAATTARDLPPSAWFAYDTWLERAAPKRARRRKRRRPRRA